MMGRLSSAIVVMILSGACSTTMHPSGRPESTAVTSTSPTLGSTTTAKEPATSGVPTTSVPTTPPWCASGDVVASAGPAYSVYGNGEAVDVTVSQVGTGACRMPSTVTVILTDKSGGTISSAQSSPQSGELLTLAAGHQAKLRLDWVSQGCFSAGAVAAGAELEWATPKGSPSLVIQGLGRDAVAPCHSAFGVSALQPAS